MKLSEFKVKDRAWYLDKILSMVECFAFYEYPDDLNDAPAAAADDADDDDGEMMVMILLTRAPGG